MNRFERLVAKWLVSRLVNSGRFGVADSVSQLSYELKKAASRTFYEDNETTLDGFLEAALVRGIKG